MEDIDQTRCTADHAQTILRQLTAHGLISDGPVAVQSHRLLVYAQALEQLRGQTLVYPCMCSRKMIEMAWDETAEGTNLGTGVSTGLTATNPSHREGLYKIYPGTCRYRAPHHDQPGAWRLNLQACLNNAAAGWPSAPQPANNGTVTASGQVHWVDRRLGPQCQDVTSEVGDFVLKRADGMFTYQLAVVVDDADQGITHVVRGEDLTDNTPRQIWLQKVLGLPTPTYLHTPLVVGPDGKKLSKQNGAQALDSQRPLENLNDAARILGLPTFDAVDTLSTPSIQNDREALIERALTFWISAWKINGDRHHYNDRPAHHHHRPAKPRPFPCKTYPI
jgi:glutamyl-Q tRNA(Asp) synthetase